jgi:hypothetical protein
MRLAIRVFVVSETWIANRRFGVGVDHLWRRLPPQRVRCCRTNAQTVVVKGLRSKRRRSSAPPSGSIPVPGRRRRLFLAAGR